ncbi:hypothetical protein PPYR_00194 [Photinus pyralis]|uniref:DUF659 domain-containing protein n=2 Tax=Photinus pyralis TaxID=7054 RepID=A0A5N4B0W0_PHOPY|nr:hypothetical protein PPYR_00194 [Photinus pyralis]
MSANVPLNKLSNPQFKSFLEKYCKKSVPDQSTLRKRYVSECYTETMNNIRQTVQNRFLFFVVDETTDVCGRYIANLMVGVLGESSSNKSFLISCKHIEKTNNETISRFIVEGLSNLFLPKAVPHDKIVLMLSDAAPYMIKAAQNLKIFYPNLIHNTCLAHGVNRVAEEVRNQFPVVNDFINNVKKVFVKAPLRVQLYKEMLPGIPLPPKPILTRWGTWVEAALFYAQHFESIKKVLTELSSEDSSAAISESNQLAANPQLSQQLAYIKNNFSIFPKLFLELEKQDVLLIDAINLIENFKKTMNSLKGKIGKCISKKLNDTLSKNNGYQILKNVSMVLMGDIVEGLEIDPNILSALSNAPITSVDVERSFSAYKLILSDRRQSFLAENLEKHIIVSVNSNITINLNDATL